MHISEGVLSPPVLAAGAALAAAGLAVGFRAIRDEDTPKAAVLAAVFFTASLIHVNIGPGSAHLVLSGLIGLMLGWAAFPVIFLGLLLQGILFGFGGLTTLGVNTFDMAAPAVLFGVLLRPMVNGRSPAVCGAGGLLCGALPVLASGALVGAALVLSGERGEYTAIAWAVVAANLPIAVIEGLVGMFAVQFLRKVRPDLLRRSAFGAPLPDAALSGPQAPSAAPAPAAQAASMTSMASAASAAAPSRPSPSPALSPAE